jgi:hypothetical protein
MVLSSTPQQELDKRGHIYRGSHSGWYAISDECFYTEGQTEDVVDPVTKEKIKVRDAVLDKVEILMLIDPSDRSLLRVVRLSNGLKK